MNDPLLLAYLAGVVDSDGYVSIVQSRHADRLYFGAAVGISGTRRQPHDLAVSLWGGKVYEYTPKNPRHRPQFQWQRVGDGAHAILTELLPYLRVKRENAELAIDAQEFVWFGRGDDPYPWMGPGYSPEAELADMRTEMISMLNQDRQAGADGLRVGKKAAGRLLDGRTWDEFPAS